MIVRAVVAMLAAAFLVGGCGSPSSLGVVIDRTRWEVLLDGGDGMRGRTGFDGADGMLFDLDREVDPGAVVFVMDGVKIPLDVAWFDGSGALLATASMVPCPDDPCPVYEAPAPFRWAIEAPPGAFASFSPGARLEVLTLG